MAALCALFAPPAEAETLTYNSASSTAEAAWSNCPHVAAFDGERCNYTAVFAGRGNRFQPFFIIHMMNLAVYTNGTAQIVAASAGYVQPAATVQVAQGTLATATASGAVYLYGDCGDPNDLSTCTDYGVGSVSARWRASGAMLRWSDTKHMTEAGTKYVYKINGGSRPSTATGSAGFRGGPWYLGRHLTTRITRFDINQSQTCPGACPHSAQSAQRVPTPEALLKHGPGTEGSVGPHPDAAQHVPLNELQNAGPADQGFNDDTAARSFFNPFDFSSLGQVRSIFQSTGFFGGAPLSGLNQFVDNLLTSYLASGR